MQKCHSRKHNSSNRQKSNNSRRNYDTTPLSLFDSNKLRGVVSVML